MKYSYEEIRNAILERNIELLIEYKEELYWITIGKKSCFGDSDGKVDLVFPDPEKLLNSVLVDHKTLSEIWEDVDVFSYEDGWNTTRIL